MAGYLPEWLDNAEQHLADEFLDQQMVADRNWLDKPGNNHIALEDFTADVDIIYSFP